MSSSIFETWLERELVALSADVGVFVPYITSILDNDGEEEEEVIFESLKDTIASITDQTDIEALAKKIIDKWKAGAEEASGEVGKVAQAEEKLEQLDLGARLAEITASQTAAYAASRASTSNPNNMPDKSVKAAILAQYGGVVEESSEEEEEDSDQDFEAKNVNSEAVAQAEKEKREKSKAAHIAKKEKDKEDREKQKKQADERKKKAQEKSAKVERKR